MLFRDAAWIAGALIGLATACGGKVTGTFQRGSGGAAAGGSTGGSGASGGTGGTRGSGGFGGTGAFGGSGAFGGTGGCSGTSCGPDGAPCCEPNMGCGVAGPGGYSCLCQNGRWSCSGGTGGGGGQSCFTNQDCGMLMDCCGGHCINYENDIYNCGGCGVVCGGLHPYCNNGTCTAPVCLLNRQPPPGMFCCGAQDCLNGQLCCSVGPGGPECYTPTMSQPTCPVGCPGCLY